jgi:uncharacterized delta-60 repeat protein
MAHPGDLDTSFAGNGKKAINFGGSDQVNAVLVQGDGKILLVGGGGPNSSFCVARLRTNGNLDTTFGSGGKRIVDFGGADESAFAAALQPDGKIVLAGDSHVQPAVARLNANGSLDTTFSGDGKRIFSWGPIGRVTGVVVLSSGKLLLGGFSGPEGGDIQLARMKPNGQLDTTFATGGIATVDLGSTEFGDAMARQANGRIVIAGRTDPGGAVVARVRTTGVLDPDFATDGRLAFHGGGAFNAVRIQPDRKIVVAGNIGGSQAMNVARLTSAGLPDAGFGTNGIASIQFGSFGNYLYDALLQPDGKIVAVGYTQQTEEVAVARLNPDGSPDLTFGTAGKATVDFGVATFGLAGALQKNGRILVAGQRSGSDDFAVARLLG